MWLIHLLLAQLIEQQPGVEAGTGADRQGQARVGQWADEQQVEQLRHHQGENGDLHRRADVLLGVEPGASTLITMIPSKPTE